MDPMGTFPSSGWFRWKNWTTVFLHILEGIDQLNTTKSKRIQKKMRTENTHININMLTWTQSFKWARFKTFYDIPNLRIFQHTPGTYPRPSTTCLWSNSLHLRVWGCLGYAPGVCWASLRPKKPDWFIWILSLSCLSSPRHWKFVRAIAWKTWVFFGEKNVTSHYG